MTVDGYKVSFGYNERVLKLDLVMIAQLSEYSKNYAHFKRLNLMVCKLYVNEDITKNEQSSGDMLDTIKWFDIHICM